MMLKLHFLLDLCWVTHSNDPDEREKDVLKNFKEISRFLLFNENREESLSGLFFIGFKGGGVTDHGLAPKLEVAESLLIRERGVCPTAIRQEIWQFVLRPHTMSDEDVEKLYKQHPQLVLLANWVEDIEDIDDWDCGECKIGGEASADLKAALKHFCYFRQAGFIDVKHS